MASDPNSGGQFILAADEIAKGIIREAGESDNEEDLRIRVEYLLRQKIFEKLKIPWAKYESRTGKGNGTVINGKADAMAKLSSNMNPLENLERGLISSRRVIDTQWTR